MQHRVPDHLDLRVLEQAILQDLLGAEMVAPVHDRHLAGEVGQEQRFLDRGVAAADHEHLLAAIEEAVAGRAGRNAEALELLLGRKIEPARLRAGREHDGVGEIDVAAVAFDAERALLEVEPGDVVGDEPRADVLGLLLHLLHQPRALDHLGEARIVLDVGRDGELAAGLHAADQDRLQHRARRIDRRRASGRAGADDDQLGMGDFRHAESSWAAERPRPVPLGRRGRRPAESCCSAAEFKFSGRAMQDTQPGTPQLRVKIMAHGSR